jgi:hypothetical protein
LEAISCCIEQASQQCLLEGEISRLTDVDQYTFEAQIGLIGGASQILTDA